MLMVCAGGYISIMGVSGYGATPLLVVTGVAMMAYAVILLIMESGFFGKAVVRAKPAHPCLQMNHAGCQDSPDCICGCHRERIEIKVGSY